MNIQFMIPSSIGLVGLESLHGERVDAAGTVFILCSMFIITLPNWYLPISSLTSISGLDIDELYSIVGLVCTVV